MSLHRTVTVGSLAYDFAPDDSGLLARRTWALAEAQALDEIEEQPLRVPLRVRVEQSGVLVKTGDDATFALVARPWLRFPPQYAPHPQLDVVVEADGYLPRAQHFTLSYDQRSVAAPAPAIGANVLTLNSTANLVAGQVLLLGPAATPEHPRIAQLGPGANQVTLSSGLYRAHNVGDAVFPDAFDPGPAALLRMHRLPLVIRGRVARRNTATGESTGAGGASITVADFWRTRGAVRTHQPGSMTDPNPAQRSFAVSVSPGALAVRAAGASAGDASALGAVPNEDKFLRRDAAAGDDRIELSDRVNLAPGQLLRLDADDPSVAEYATAAAVLPSGGPPEPASVALDLPLLEAHRARTRVGRFGPPGAPATPRTVRDEVLPGDACLFLDDLNLIPAQGRLRIAGGGAADEYQSYSQLAATADGDGYFRLPAIQRMAQLQIVVVDGANNRTIDLQPDYSRRDAWLDVAFAI